MRTDKINYYFGVAKAVAERGTCIRRKYGAIIVKDDAVISTGYVGSPRGRTNCCDIGSCEREKQQIPSGQRYELCVSVHAEANAIISAARSEMIGSTLYLVGIENDGSCNPNTMPCMMCERIIINAGIEKLFVKTGPKDEDYKEFLVKDLV